MAEKYFTRTEGDDIVVTRKSDRKTIAFPRVTCADETGRVRFKIAVALAKACDDSIWE